jgi:hypothetical protein
LNIGETFKHIDRLHYILFELTSNNLDMQWEFPRFAWRSNFISHFLEVFDHCTCFLLQDFLSPNANPPIYACFSRNPIGTVTAEKVYYFRFKSSLGKKSRHSLSFSTNFRTVISFFVRNLLPFLKTRTFAFSFPSLPL